MTNERTREAWLQAFTNAARPKFKDVGAKLPEAIRVSVGHPSKGIRSKVIGECWADFASEDGAVEIFIRPTLQSDSARVADVLTHELIHAALGNEEGHGPKFRVTMKRLGLTGKATATVAGPEWHSWADPILAALGPLPGANLKDMSLAGGKKTQTTRYLKVSCSMCEWQARVTAKHIEGRTLRCPDDTCEGHLERAE
ncbi:SprT-like domain-containing protein [Sphingobium sp. CCH11-B1]|uniref:SprT-like domain-containing protein n=1 Tax=Sphingobium sp. CCH11-B1 TaxID=1768781 RepID=UPI0008366630|nr:SprT-like domain-containing protein [Sphingobium sp. CCH11-B1]